MRSHNEVTFQKINTKLNKPNFLACFQNIEVLEQYIFSKRPQERSTDGQSGYVACFAAIRKSCYHVLPETLTTVLIAIRTKLRKLETEKQFEPFKKSCKKRGR